MDPRKALTIAEGRIAEEAERRTGSLDSSDLGLPELPEVLFELRHLRVLNLGTSESWGADAPNNQVDCQRTRLAALTGLEALSLTGTDLSGLDFFQELTAPQQLDCSHTRVSDVTPLAGLPALRQVDCSAAQVRDLTISGLH